jgi:hypothetical protein
MIAQQFCHIVDSSSNSQLRSRLKTMVSHSFASRDPEHV